MQNYPEEAISVVPCPNKGIVKLAPGEFLIKCPYDSNHLVLNSRFHGHLEKCRRNYERMFRDKGKTPLKLSCKYNVEHEIHAPELLYHEHSCFDKENLMLEYLLMDRDTINRILGGHHVVKFDDDYPPSAASSSVGFAEGEEEAFGFKRWKEDCRIDLNQLAWDLVHMGKLMTTPIGVQGSGRVVWPDPNSAKKTGMRCKVGGRALPDELFAKTTGIPTTNLNIGMPLQGQAFPMQPAQPGSSKKKGQALGEDEEDVDSEAYWAKSSGAKFDWLEHQYQLNWKPVGPVNQYPPGLTKGQRKQFVKWNAERMKMDSFYDEELARLTPGSGNPNRASGSAIDKLCDDVEKLKM